MTARFRETAFLPGRLARTVPSVVLFDEADIIEDPLTQEDYQRLKGVMPTFRDLLILKCLRCTGLRIGELLGITPAYIRDDGVQLEFKVKRGKKKRKEGDQAVYEMVALPPELSVEMRAFISGQGLGPGDAIFNTVRGPLSARQVRNVFAAAGRTVVDHPVHPHELRGLYITDLIDRGLPIEATAKMVGHDDIRTTQKWYYKLTAERRRAIQREIPV